jgi:integrase/recombinase XerD
MPTIVALMRSCDAAGNVSVRLGLPLMDEYLEFLAGRCRPNTVLAVAYDLKVFRAATGKPPEAVTTADVLAFITAQRAGGQGRLQVAGQNAAGVSARTLRRRLSSVSGLYSFLQARRDVAANPVPRGLPTRRERQRPRQGVPLVKVTRILPVTLSPAEVDVLTAALRTHRDRAMVAAMVLGGLRRCEVLGLRLEDLRFGERRVFIAKGKGGHQRLIPVSPRFFAEVSAYLDAERPASVCTDRVFVVLKGPRRGRPLSAEGLDEILEGARGRAGLARGLSSAAPYLPDPAAGSGDGAGSSAGAGRSRLGRVNADLPAPGR